MKKRKLRKIQVNPATTNNLEMKPTEAWSEDRITKIISQTLDKSLKIYLPIVYVLLTVYYWVYNTCSMTKIEI